MRSSNSSALFSDDVSLLRLKSYESMWPRGIRPETVISQIVARFRGFLRKVGRSEPARDEDDQEFRSAD